MTIKCLSLCSFPDGEVLCSQNQLVMVEVKWPSGCPLMAHTPQALSGGANRRGPGLIYTSLVISEVTLREN